MARLTFHGHACWMLTTDDGMRIMFDPFLTGNPQADIKAEDIDKLDFMFASHGHGDHYVDAIDIAKRTGATFVSAYELVGFTQSRGVKNAHPLQIGGGHKFPFGYAKLTAALHGGAVEGSDGKVTTTPCGIWIDLGPGKRVYHAGDTALLMDMQLLKGKVDIAMLPIGDNFTMGPDDAVRAVEFIEPRVVLPMHYNTWEIIQQDPHEFKKKVGARAEVVILQPGNSYEF
jgi:L-ascorbate metabolism protein UlaG (beta-lactamase superfamily)